MKIATKYIFISIGLEVLVLLITFFILLPYDFIYLISDAVKYIIIGAIPTLFIGYQLGEKIAYEKYGNIRILWGIGIQFLLLLIALFVIWLAISVAQKALYKDVLILLLFAFLSHGGLQTLLLGTWLGYKLNKITKNE